VCERDLDAVVRPEPRSSLVAELKHIAPRTPVIEKRSLNVGFTQRQNNDATIDSICNNCFLVVARVFGETDLEYLERRYVCQPTDLEYLERRHVCQPFERRKHIRTVHQIFRNDIARIL
jgi:hypothetical protein